MSRFDDHVRVGGVSISMRVAAAWIHQYTDPRHIGSTTPYAFPAYDRYRAVDRAPLSLSDADLLAPVLLNVAPSLRAYYALQRVRPRLEAALAHPLLEQPLAGLSEGRSTRSSDPSTRYSTTPPHDRGAWVARPCRRSFTASGLSPSCSMTSGSEPVTSARAVPCRPRGGGRGVTT